MKRVLYAIRQLIQEGIQDASSSSLLSKIKKVYFGDPILIPQDSQPCITIMPIETKYAVSGTKKDRKTHSVEVRIVFNVKDFFQGSTQDAEVVQAVQGAIDIGEDTTLSTNTTDADTVCGIIQNNLSLPFTYEGTSYRACERAKVTSVSYGFPKDRPFETYEVIVQVEALVVADR